jgi:hypothetical protein
MRRFDVKERLASVAGRAQDLTEALAIPLQQAHLSPLRAMVLAFLGLSTFVSALFAAYAFLGSLGSNADVKAPDWAPPTLAVGELDPPKPPNEDVETLSRPIFTKSRRPSPKAAAPQVAPETGPISETPSGVSVSAIVKNRDGAQAFIVSPESPDGAWKKIGDTVDSWTIATIAGAEITLKNGERAAKLKLYAEEQAQPAPPEQPPQPEPPQPPPAPGN